MTWRERIARAQQRERRWWSAPIRALRAAGMTMYWPFTFKDGDLMLSMTTCVAGEYANRYGIDYFEGYELWRIGDELHRRLMRGDTRAVDTLCDRIEDLALEIKRGAAE